jgi:hypothetical protein
LKNAAWRASFGHIPELVTLDTAINAGQHGMEHFGRVAMACSSAESEMIDELRDAIPLPWRKKPHVSSGPS